MQPYGRGVDRFKPRAELPFAASMGNAQRRGLERPSDSPAQSGQRLVPRTHATTGTAPLLRPRPLEDQWDDRFGLLPPEPPASAAHADSVMMALSDLDANSLPTYGSFPGLPTTGRLLAELKNQLNTGLSFVGGYVDAVGFVALMGLFPAHVTGELVALSAQLTATDAPAHHQALLAALFLGGVVVSVLLGRWTTRTRRSQYTFQLALLGATLLAFLGFGASGITRGGGLWVTAAAGAAVFAMGVQNAIMRSALSGTLPTTVMTGNLTQFITELLNWACGRFDSTAEREHLHQSLRRVVSLARPLGAFFGGAILGAWLTREVGLLSVALPAVIVVSMTFYAIAVERELATQGTHGP